MDSTVDVENIDSIDLNDWRELLGSKNEILANYARYLLTERLRLNATNSSKLLSVFALLQQSRLTKTDWSSVEKMSISTIIGSLPALKIPVCSSEGNINRIERLLICTRN